jgi:Tol biopolymer transport system component
LFRLSLDGDGTVSPLLRGIQGRVSPNGRWLAYTAIDSPNRQVYVTTFPEPTERWRISTASGEDPQWRSDGSELFYVEDRQTVTSVPVSSGDDFRIGTAQPLFRAFFAVRSMVYGPTYAVSGDGQRFVVLESEREREVLLRVTTNWAPGR